MFRPKNTDGKENREERKKMIGLTQDEMNFLNEIYSENFEKDFTEWIELMEKDYIDNLI